MQRKRLIVQILVRILCAFDEIPNFLIEALDKVINIFGSTSLFAI